MGNQWYLLYPRSQRWPEHLSALKLEGYQLDRRVGKEWQVLSPMMAVCSRCGNGAFWLALLSYLVPITSSPVPTLCDGEYLFSQITFLFSLVLTPWSFLTTLSQVFYTRKGKRLALIGEKRRKREKHKGYWGGITCKICKKSARKIKHIHYFYCFQVIILLINAFSIPTPKKFL